MIKPITKQLKKRWIPLGLILSLLVACRADLDTQSIEQTQASAANQPIQNHKIDWTEIQPFLKLSIPENQRIKKEKERFLKQPHYIEQVLQNAEPYLPFILQEINANHLPIELVLLPFIESNYNIKPVPKGRAAGLWQIMPITGKSLELKQNNTYDERLDIIASTSAAVSLLKTLNDRFNGDWLLTLAAYNAGSGAVNKAIKKNQRSNLPTDYWSLSLPQETMRYIPKFLAILEIVKNHQNYKVNLPKFDQQNQFAILQVNEKTSLKSLAHLLKIDENELKKLNPAFLSRVANKNKLVYIKQADLELNQKQETTQLIQFKEPIKLTFSSPDNKTIETIQVTNQRYKAKPTQKKENK